MKPFVITHATAGILLFLGSLQWIIFSVVSDTISRGSFPQISDVNIQVSILSPYISSSPLSLITYSVSTEIFGVLIIISALILHKTYRFTLFTLFFSVSGIVLIGIGLFSSFIEENQTLSMIWYVSTSCSAVTAYFLVRKPVSYCSLLTGIFCFAVLLLPNFSGYIPPLYLPGADEIKKILDIILIVWISALGGYFMGSPETFSFTRR
jgi:hypothetical protein